MRVRPIHRTVQGGRIGPLEFLEVVLVAMIAATLGATLRFTNSGVAAGDALGLVAADDSNQSLSTSPSCATSCYPTGATNGTVGSSMASPDSVCVPGCPPPYVGNPSPSTAVGSGGTASPTFSGGASNYYQIGTYYLTSDPTYEAAAVWTSILVPSSGTISGDEFTLTLNVVDDLGYYDQLGLSSDYGCSGCQNPYNTWSVAYEQGQYGSQNGGPVCCGCGPNSVIVRDAYNGGGLEPDSWYTFEMLLADDYLYFYVWEGKDLFNVELWGTSVPDDAQYFLIESEANICYGAEPGTTSLANMNLYEEVENVHSPLNYPQWNFRFFNTSFYVSPSGPTIVIPNSWWMGNWTSGYGTRPADLQRYYTSFDQGLYQVEVINEPFRISFPTDSCSVSPGNWCSETGYLEPAGQFAPTDYCVFWGCPVSSSTCGGPAGWTVECALANPVPTYVDYGSAIWNLYVPSSASLGAYYGGIGLTVSNSTSSDSDNWIFYIFVS